MLVLLRTCGGALLALAGAGTGYVLARSLRRQQLQMHAFVRLLDYLCKGIRYRGSPGEELLQAAAQYPEFAALGVAGCRRFAQLPVPAPFEPALRTEAAEVLAALAADTREGACAGLRRLLELCGAAEQEKRETARQAARLYPRLGGCIGLLAAIVFW